MSVVAEPEKQRVIVRSHAALRKVKYAAREAARAVKELERFADADVFGRFVYRGPEDESELGEFLRFAFQQHKGQELEITIVARMGKEEKSNGRSVQR